MKTTPEPSPLLIEVVDILGRRWAFSPKAVAYLCDAPGGGTLIAFKSNYTCTVPADYTKIRDQIFAAMPHLAQEPSLLEQVNSGQVKLTEAKLAEFGALRGSPFAVGGIVPTQPEPESH